MSQVVAARSIRLGGRPVGQAIPAIITPLVGRTLGDIVRELAVILPKRPDMLEWRADFFRDLRDRRAVVDVATAIKSAAPETPLIFTRRAAQEGGQPVGMEESAVLDIYAAVCGSRAIDFADYELAHDRANRLFLRAVSGRSGVGLILSYHNFRETPAAEDLIATCVDAEAFGADIAKVAVMPQRPSDVDVLLDATAAAHARTRIPLITMSMGTLGVRSRTHGWQYGSAATFAVGLATSAPGQMAIEELRREIEQARLEDERTRLRCRD